MAGTRTDRVDTLRHELLELHRAVLDAQRIQYERTHGRVETSGELLGLVLEHRDFDWIRALSALIARLDAWAEEKSAATDAALAAIVGALRDLVRPGGVSAFGARYWAMVESEPDVTVAHVKVWKLIGQEAGWTDSPGATN